MCEYTKEYMSHLVDEIPNIAHIIDVTEDDIALLVGKKKSIIINLDSDQSIVIRYNEKGVPVNDRAV